MSTLPTIALATVGFFYFRASSGKPDKEPTIALATVGFFILGLRRAGPTRESTKQLVLSFCAHALKLQKCHFADSFSQFA